eukprot:gene27074-2306_t
MGALFSRQVAWGSYEKGFDKIEKETAKILAGRSVRQKWIGSYMARSFSLFVVTVMISIAHVVWVQQQPDSSFTVKEQFTRSAISVTAPLIVQQQPAGSFTVKEHLTRSAISVTAPLIVWLVYGSLKAIQVFWEKRDDRRLKKMGEAKKKMDITLYEKTSALIKKYGGPEEQNVKIVHVPAKGSKPVVKARTSSGGSDILMGTAARASRTIFPILDHLAKSVIGDNPQLLDDISKANATESTESRQRLISEVFDEQQWQQVRITKSNSGSKLEVQRAVAAS